MNESMKRPNPEVVHRKLGKHKADGLSWFEENIIEIDSRITGKDHLETIIHEMLHILNPKWGEIKIDGHAKKLAKILWDQNYRKVLL
jgi:hypothetical protein